MHFDIECRTNTTLESLKKHTFNLNKYLYNNHIMQKVKMFFAKCRVSLKQKSRQKWLCLLVLTTIVVLLICKLDCCEDNTDNEKITATMEEEEVNFTQNILQKNAEFKKLQHLQPLDPAVVSYIKKYHLYQPSLKPYNLSNPESDPSEFKEQLEQILTDKKEGVFIECGANDGEFLSNTLELERKHGWKGILIEANPIMIPKLLAKNRKSFIFDVCLSPSLRPEKIQFLDHKGDHKWQKGAGKLLPSRRKDIPLYFERKSYSNVGLVECFPLISILEALNISHIDYFSLDVEGSELAILKTIPFDKVDIKIIQVEHWIVPEGKKIIQKFLQNNGYIKIFETKSDFIFEKHIP